VNSRKNISGVTLIELLIALALGLILTAGAVNIFISNKGTYNLENELSRLQENGRFAIESMIEDLRMVDYTGCSSRTSLTVNNIAKAPIPISPFDTTNSIRGYNATTTSWEPTIPTNLNLSSIINGTDVLNIQRAGCGAQLNATYAANVAVGVANSCGFEANNVVLITDCVRAETFEIDSVSNASNSQTLGHSSTRNNNSGTLNSGSFTPQAHVYLVRSVAYYIANNTNGIRSLFRSSWLPDGDDDVDTDDFIISELATGIEDMQILYGEDESSDEYTDTYKTANNVTDWSNVRSVRINLLLYSNDNVTQQPRTIQFNGNSVGGSDNRLRLVYTSTVSLRNRLP